MYLHLIFFINSRHGNSNWKMHQLYSARIQCITAAEIISEYLIFCSFNRRIIFSRIDEWKFIECFYFSHAFCNIFAIFNYFFHFSLMVDFLRERIEFATVATCLYCIDSNNHINFSITFVCVSHHSGSNGWFFPFHILHFHFPLNILVKSNLLQSPQIMDNTFFPIPINFEFHCGYKIHILSTIYSFNIFPLRSLIHFSHQNKYLKASICLVSESFFFLKHMNEYSRYDYNSAHCFFLPLQHATAPFASGTLKCFRGIHQSKRSGCS